MMNILKIRSAKMGNGRGRKEICGKRNKKRKKTAKYSKTLEKAEAKKESEETQEVVELAEVNKEEESAWKIEEEPQFEEDGSDMDPEQAKKGREEEVKVKTLDVFEFGSWEAPDHDEMARSCKEGRRTRIREMPTRGALILAKTRRSEGGLVCCSAPL